jgi:hypothetical protein
MCYNLHITRKENWSYEDDSAEISLQEWQTYVQADDEMEMELTVTGLIKNDEASYLSKKVDFNSSGTRPTIQTALTTYKGQ